MEESKVKKHLEDALLQVQELDHKLLEYKVSERCLAARVAMYLQSAIGRDYSVDVEYNRHKLAPKTLHGLEECPKRKRRADGKSLALPDIIVHTRGNSDSNILVLELKKTTNRISRDCDLARIRAFRSQLAYRFAALIECDTVSRTMRIDKWLPEPPVQDEAVTLSAD